MTTTLPDLWQRNTLHRIRTLGGADPDTRERALSFIDALEANHLFEPSVSLAGRIGTGVGLTWWNHPRMVVFRFLVGRENEQFRYEADPYSGLAETVDADEWLKGAGSGLASWGLSGVDFCFPGRRREEVVG